MCCRDVARSAHSPTLRKTDTHTIPSHQYSFLEPEWVFIETTVIAVALGHKGGKLYSLMKLDTHMTYKPGWVFGWWDDLLASTADVSLLPQVLA